MSVFSGRQPQAPQAPQQQAPQGTQGQQVQGGGQQQPMMQDPVAAIAATAGVNAQPTQHGTQGQGQGAGGQNGELNALDAYKNLFTMQAGQQAQAEAIDAPLFKLDSEALGQTMAKANFVPQLDPALMQRALGGDQQAFMEVLNGVARNVMQQSISLTQNMVQSGVGTYHKRLDGILPDRMREFSANETLASDPSAKSPAANPVMKAMVQNIMKADPSKSVQQALKEAQGFVQALASQYQPAPVQQGKDPLTGQTLGAQAETDWSREFM